MASLRTRLARIVGGTALVLAIPLVMTSLGTGVDGDGWHWTPLDFIVMAVLLLATGLALDVVVHRVRRPVLRIAACAAVVLAFVATWAELAVDAVSQALRMLS